MATLGLSRTASNRIVGRFDELVATEIIVQARPAPSRAVAVQIPWDAETRLDRLEGVVASGTLSAVDVGGALVRTSPVSDPACGAAAGLDSRRNTRLRCGTIGLHGVRTDGNLSLTPGDLRR